MFDTHTHDSLSYAATHNATTVAENRQPCSDAVMTSHLVLRPDTLPLSQKGRYAIGSACPSIILKSDK